MIHLSSAVRVASFFKRSLGFMLGLFGLDLPVSQGETAEMPKVDPPANTMKQFMFNNDFQRDFDAWKAEVERTGNGTLEITHEEPLVSQGSSLGITIFYRIVPRPVIARRR